MLREVRDSIAIFLSIHNFQHGSPAAAEIRERIVGLGLHATSVAKAIVDLQPFLEVLPPPPGQKTPYVPSVKFLGDLKKLAEVASMAAETKSSSGRPADQALRFLIFDLADLFHACTGKKPSVSWRGDHGEYRGRFLELVAVCVAAAGIEMTNEALGMGIRRALKKWIAT